MTTISWKNDADGNWNTAANWSTGTVPGAGDDVTVNTPSLHTISYSSGTDSVRSLYFGTNDTLALSAGKLSVTGNTTFYGKLTETGGSLALGGSNAYIAGTISQTAGTLTATSGTMTIAGTGNSFAGKLTGATVAFSTGSDIIAAGAVLALQQIQLTGATVTLNEALTQAGSWLQTGGTLSIGGNALSLAGPTTLDGGVMAGSGTVTLAGATEISASFAAEGQIALVNTGIVDQSGYFYLGYNGTDTTTLVNKAGATYRFDNDTVMQASVGATLTNAGTLLKSGGASVSQVAANTVSTGTITVASGDLRFVTGSDSFGGLINGGGLLELNGGTDLLASGLSISVGTLLLDGSTVNLGATLTYGGAYEESAGTLALGSSTLALTGPATFSGGAISGSGNIMLGGATDLGATVLTGSVVMKNTGTLIQSGTFYVGYSGSDTAKFLNAAGATWQIDGNAITYGQTGDQITNAGSLVKATGAGTAQISPSFASTGTVTVNSGTLRVTGGTNSFAGTVSGAGTLLLSGAADTLSKGLALKVAHVGQDTGVLTIASKLSYAGVWSQTGGTLSLGSQTLTLTGTDAFDGGSASGSGTISVKNAEFGGYALTGSAILKNTGSITVTGTLYDGYYSGDTAQIINAVKTTLTIEGNNTIYGSAGSLLTNAGTLIKANGTGVSAINASTASTGTVTVASGTLRFAGAANSFAGTIGGAGTIEFNTGADTLAAGVAISTGALLFDGANVTLGGDLTLAKTLLDVTGGTLSLGGHNLSVTGAEFDGGAVTGAGTVTLAGTTGFGAFVFEGAASINNTGTIDVYGNSYIGYNSSDTVQLANKAGATIRLENGASFYGSSGSGIANAGTLIKAGVATSLIADSTTSSGTITIASGTLRFSGASNSFGGTIGGAGALELNTGADSFAAGTTLATGAVLLDGGNLTVANALSYAGLWSQTTGTTTISGATLTLSNHFAWTGGYVSGAGTLALTGATSIDGGALSGSAKIVNSGTITQTGAWYVGYNSTDTATFTNTAAGVLQIQNGATIYGDAGSNISNAGSIVKTGAATTSINVAFANIGSVELSQGSMTFAAAVNGAGTFTVDAGTALGFSAAVAAGGQVFLGADTLLGVNTTAGFGDTVHGFAAGDIIDLNGLGYGATDTATFNAGTLTVSNGTTSTMLHLAGSYTSASFALFNDHGYIGVSHT